MRLYTFPKWLRGFFPGAIWEGSPINQTIYLTFDDGPHPEATIFVLEELRKVNAKATFFCLGKNVALHPTIFNQIQDEGHEIGNHGYQHLKGWKTDTKTYLRDVEKGAKLISSTLFRPAYGKLKLRQFKAIQKLGFTPVFWSFISYDFDRELTSEKRLENLKEKVKPGDIIVFHDSAKALPQLKKELPEILAFWKSKGYQFKPIKKP